MGKKKTQGEFEKEVYDLVGDEFEVIGSYLGANVKIQFIHKKCNRILEITPSNFLSHNLRCKHCHIESMRCTYEEVNEYIKGIGYILISDNYINSKEKLTVKCHKGHVFEMGLSTLKAGSRCPECNRINIGNRCRLDGNLIINEFKLHNFIPLFSESDYKGNDKKLPCLCINHKEKGVQYIAYSHLRQGGSCKFCYEDSRGDFRRKDVNLVIKEFKDRNYAPMFSPEEYKNNSVLLPYICLSHTNEGVQYITYGNLQNNKGCKYCGLEKISGKNSYLWRGGITDKNKKVRNSKEYKYWRNQVFERDNYTCQICGKRGVNLHAHHIDNFADNPELRLDIKNGITICRSHHSPYVLGSFHNVYGKYNNTHEQLEEYKKRYELGELKELKIS